MDMLLLFFRHLFLELKPGLEWALRNWAATLAVLIGLLYWARRHRRTGKYHYY